MLVTVTFDITTKDQKTVKAAAQTFRTNSKFNTEAAILELGTGLESEAFFLQTRNRDRERLCIEEG